MASPNFSQPNISRELFQDCQLNPEHSIYTTTFVQMTDTVYVTLCVINTMFAVAAFLGNLTVITAITTAQALHSPSYILLCSLAFTDIGIGVIVQPLRTILYILEKNATFESVCNIGKAYSFWGYFLCGASLLTVTSISVDRYLAIRLTYRYRTIVTKRRVLILVGIVWAGTVIYSSGQWYLTERAFFTLTIFIVFTCLSLISTSYTLSFRSIRKHQIHIKGTQDKAEITNRPRLDVAKFKRTLVTMLLIVALLLICYTPYIIVSALVTLKVMMRNIAWEIALLSVYINSTLNPVLCVMRIRDIKKGCLRVLTRLCCGENSKRWRPPSTISSSFP